MSSLATLRAVLQKSAAARKAAQAVDNPSPGLPIFGGLIRSAAGIPDPSPNSGTAPGMSFAGAAGAGALGALGVAGIYALYRKLKSQDGAPAPSPGAG